MFHGLLFLTLCCAVTVSSMWTSQSLLAVLITDRNSLAVHLIFILLSINVTFTFYYLLIVDMLIVSVRVLQYLCCLCGRHVVCLLLAVLVADTGKADVPEQIKFAQGLERALNLAIRPVGTRSEKLSRVIYCAHVRASRNSGLKQTLQGTSVKRRCRGPSPRATVNFGR
jgi:hypothetical protein